MRRRWRFLVLAGLLGGAAALGFLVTAGGRAGGFTVSTIWTAPWGRRGLAVVTGADGRRYGPLAFALGRGRVVLADSFSRRLWLIPARGGTPAVAAFGANGPLVEDLAVARDGTIYLADRGAELWRWRSGMAAPQRVARLRDSAGGLTLVEGLGVLPTGDPVVDLLSVTRRRAERSVFVLGAGGRHHPVIGLTQDERSAGAPGPPGAAVPAGGHSLAVGANGGIYVLGYAPGGGRAVYRYDAAGRLLATVPAPGGPGHWSLLGIDRRGRIYLGFDLGSPRGRLRILGPRGRTETSRALPMAGAVQMGTYVRVSPAGGLYVATPSRRGLTLQHWRRRRGFTWRLP